MIIKSIAFIYQNLGWFFCEIAFKWPDSDNRIGYIVWVIIPKPCYTIGNWFYNKTICIENKYNFRLATW